MGFRFRPGWVLRRRSPGQVIEEPEAGVFQDIQGPFESRRGAVVGVGDLSGIDGAAKVGDVMDFGKGAGVGGQGADVGVDGSIHGDDIVELVKILGVELSRGAG